MAVIKDLLVEQGATFSLPFRLMNQASATPVDLTGYTGKGYIKKRITDESPVAEFIITIVDALEGKGLIYLSAEMSALLAAGIDRKAPLSQYVYDVKLISPSNTLRLFEGKLQVSPEVTKL